MTCPACATAQLEPHYEFRAGCRGCCARAAARSPQHFQARKEGRQTREYRALLEHFGLTHQEVKDAYLADALHRRSAVEPPAAATATAEE